MPGMMDTVLNLGMNDTAVEGLAAKTGNPRFAWDSFRRFIAMFSNVVKGYAKPLGVHVIPYLHFLTVFPERSSNMFWRQSSGRRGLRQIPSLMWKT